VASAHSVPILPGASLLSSSALLHRLVNLLLLDGCILLTYRALRGTRRRHLSLLLIFLHPTFVYPITWIFGRNDLPLTLFLLLTRLQLRRPE
jgi:hypothetical protein